MTIWRRKEFDPTETEGQVCIMDSKSMFPHDGEHGRSCSGYCCDCDERYYGTPGKVSPGKWLRIAIISGVVIGAAFNELAGAIILLGVLYMVMWM